MNKSLLLFLAIALVLTSCENQPTQNRLTEQEKEEGWQLLFDGKTLNGWHIYNQPDAQPVWKVIEGVIECDPDKHEGESGDLVTDKVFENFELTFEWQLKEAGNSGVFINVLEDPEYLAAWFTGPEYQLLDSGNKDFEVLEKRSGCVYGFSPQITETAIKPVGEWNFSKIKQSNGKVEFYLNGNLTGRVDFNSDEWKAFVANSTFKNFPTFGESTKGRIALQLWNSPVWFRNIKIKEF